LRCLAPGPYELTADRFDISLGSTKLAGSRTVREAGLATGAEVTAARNKQKTLVAARERAASAQEAAQQATGPTARTGAEAAAALLETQVAQVQAELADIGEALQDGSADAAALARLDERITQAMLRTDAVKDRARRKGLLEQCETLNSELALRREKWACD
jgi:hypothetical protein